MQAMQAASAFPRAMQKQLFNLCFVVLTVPFVCLAQSTYRTSQFVLQLDAASQTLYSLKPASGSTSFNYVPDVIQNRQSNGMHHVGDITFRVRSAGSSTWVSVDSASSRKALTALSVSGTTLAAANMQPTLPSGSLLTVTRSWIANSDNLELRFNLTNNQGTAVEIGALGAPLEFNNIFTSRTAADTNEKCSFFDPYIGRDAGYVQVTPLLGTTSPLIVTSSSKSPFEAWRFLTEPSGTYGYQSQTFEGLYSWEFHSLAYTQNEWKSTVPWNEGTSFTLQPGQSRTYGLQFRIAPSIRQIESTVRAAGKPVAQGVPGYIVGQDMDAKLFLSYSSPVSSIAVSPTGAMTWKSTTAVSSSWVGYSVTGVQFGRARLTITYADGVVQTVHYLVTKAGVQTTADLGNFLTTKQWFEDSSDPFTRSPSVISYDYEAGAVAKNDPRVWISGLSDEGGAGSWLAASMKQFAQPQAAEVAKMERFIAETLWGDIQTTNGKVRKSVFFYEPSQVPGYTYPSSVNWGNWWSWNKQASYATDRAYNYVHVVAAYWSLYRVARNYPALAKTHTWDWYLNQAVLTINALTSGGVGYTNVGLMGETVFGLVLNDLKREGKTSDATNIEAKMKARYNTWAGQRYPFGSEMAWDSTGEEGVYYWANYFKNPTLVTNTVNAILAYQPTVPHWGYNGNARRYWDNVYGGKLQRIERQLHHYGSSLNALPLISEFQHNPTDYYLLQVAYGGLSGPLSNINQAGFAAASFHSFPDTLKWDGYSGDYGPSWSGHVMGMGVYIVNHPNFGWQAYGGNIVSSSPTSVVVEPKDSVRRRIFIAPIAALLTLDAGAFTSITYNPSTKSAVVTIAESVGAGAAAPRGRLVIEKTATISGAILLKPSTSLAVEAGAFTIPFSSGQATVTLIQS